MTDALRDAAQNALDVLDEARTYTSGEAWSPSMTEECDRAMRLLRAALAAPPVAPGWVLVPVEPTQAMLDAMQSGGWMPGNYRAMLAAAPGAPDAQKGAQP